MNRQLVDATIAKFIAQREEAKAVLLTYVTNSVGVADHSNIVQEVTEWTKKLAEAEDCLQVLNRAFPSAKPKEEPNG